MNAPRYSSLRGVSREPRSGSNNCPLVVVVKREVPAPPLLPTAALGFLIAWIFGGVCGGALDALEELVAPPLTLCSCDAHTSAWLPAHREDGPRAQGPCPRPHFQGRTRLSARHAVAEPQFTTFAVPHLLAAGAHPARGRDPCLITLSKQALITTSMHSL